MPETMQAIVLDRYGPPEDVLRPAEVPVPEPGPGDVRVRVHAATVNDWDWCAVRGRPLAYRLMLGLRRPRVRILGAELAGVVEAAGADVTDLRLGDRVSGDVSEAGFGGFAERACVPATALRPIPEGLDFEAAVALPHAGGLAAQALDAAGGVADGARVLVNGAGGGVGAAALALLREHDVTVTGVDSAAKQGSMRRLGFDHVLDYRRTDFARTGERFDLVIDTRTTRGPWRLARALAPGGRYVTVGGALPRILQLLVLGPLVGRLTGRRLRILGLRPNQGLERVEALAASGRLVLPIDGPYPLADVAQAVRRFGAAEHVGKVVIRVAPARTA